jgi:RNA polymerase-interacting CarD/CdnL/TRCF family regulator
LFKIGETVVHPHHGVGTVTKLVDREFGPGGSRRYYEISLESVTLWVPADEPGRGLRPLSSKRQLARCRRILQSCPSAFVLNPRDLRQELVQHLRDGTIFAQCEVVRDLSALGWSKPLSGAMADFQRSTLNVLCQEWAQVAGVPLAEATRIILTYLHDGKQAYHGRERETLGAAQIHPRPD